MRRNPEYGSEKKLKNTEERVRGTGYTVRNCNISFNRNPKREKKEDEAGTVYKEIMA